MVNETLTQEETSAHRAEQIRDLRGEIAGLSRTDQKEVIFQVYAPARKPETIYRMSDGEPVELPEYMVQGALAKPSDQGPGFMFTSPQERAPSYKRGEIKCFLHAESTERASGLLDAVGIAGFSCIAGSLGSIYSKRIHGQHRHGQQRKALDEFLVEKKDEERIEREHEQIAATHSLAERAVGASAQAAPGKGEA